MKLGNFKIFFVCLFLILANTFFVLAEDKIESVPLINLEELSPTFEEDKSELEKVEDKTITSILDEQLSSKRYIYPQQAYQTIKLPKKFKLIPEIPDKDCFKINVIKTELSGIMTAQETIQINYKT